MKYSTVIPSYLLVVLYLIWPLYVIYFHGRWGQTLGKKIFKIQVVLLDGLPITWKAAFLRGLPDLIFNLFSLTVVFFGVIQLVGENYSIVEGVSLSVFLKTKETAIYDISSSLETIWVFSEIFVLLMNRKKRAIQDFIAGTVVIFKNAK